MYKYYEMNVLFKLTKFSEIYFYEGLHGENRKERRQIDLGYNEWKNRS